MNLNYGSEKMGVYNWPSLLGSTTCAQKRIQTWLHFVFQCYSWSYVLWNGIMNLYICMWHMTWMCFYDVQTHEVRWNKMEYEIIEVRLDETNDKKLNAT